MEPALGFKIKVVERCGRSLGSQFPLATLWDGAQCEHQDCITCRQEAEDLVYENICSTCNLTASKKGDMEQTKEGAPSLYVGETSRTSMSEVRNTGEELGATTRRTIWSDTKPLSMVAGSQTLQ